MTNTEPSEVTQESLLALASDFDAGKDIDSKPANEPVADETPPKEEIPDDNDSKEQVKEASKADKAKEVKPTDEKVKSKWAANEERKAKTWQEINADKEAIKAEREALQRERDEFQKTRTAPAEGLRDEHGASAKDYREAAQQFRAKGDVAMAEAADKLAGNIEGKEQQAKAAHAHQEGLSKWQKNLATLTEKNPDLAKPDSELSKAALQVLAEFPMLKQNPDGINYAVRAAQINLQARDFDGTKAEFTKLKADYAALQKKLSISGGSPTEAVPEGKSFSDMSLKEQRQSLERAVGQHDRDNGFD